MLHATKKRGPKTSFLFQDFRYFITKKEVSKLTSFPFHFYLIVVVLHI